MSVRSGSFRSVISTGASATGNYAITGAADHSELRTLARDCFTMNQLGDLVLTLVEDLQTAGVIAGYSESA